MKIIRYLLVALLVGCASNTTKFSKTSQDKHVVWADDGSEVAVITKHPDKELHKISVQNPDTGEKRDITDWRDYKSGKFFYMKQAGYFF